MESAACVYMYFFALSGEMPGQITQDLAGRGVIRKIESVEKDQAPPHTIPPIQAVEVWMRSMNRSPSTRASIFVRRKQSSACFGVHTTGSFSLNDVFSTIGTPVRSQKAS